MATMILDAIKSCPIDTRVQLANSLLIGKSFHSVHRIPDLELMDADLTREKNTDSDIEKNTDPNLIP